MGTTNQAVRWGSPSCVPLRQQGASRIRVRSEKYDGQGRGSEGRGRAVRPGLGWGGVSEPGKEQGLVLHEVQLLPRRRGVWLGGLGEGGLEGRQRWGGTPPPWPPPHSAPARHGAPRQRSPNKGISAAFILRLEDSVL